MPPAGRDRAVEMWIQSTYWNSREQTCSRSVNEQRGVSDHRDQVWSRLKELLLQLLKFGLPGGGLYFREQDLELLEHFGGAGSIRLFQARKLVIFRLKPLL